MDRELLQTALARVERAYARLESVAAQNPAPPQVNAPATALVEQNMQLRETIADALAEIDRLIERLEP